MTLNDWQRVAREFGDCDLEYHGMDYSDGKMVPSRRVSRVGDWLPSEPTAKEILRLRKRVEVLEKVREAAESTAIAGRHSDPCWRAMLLTGSRCVCGHADLRAALYAAKEANDG